MRNDPHDFTKTLTLVNWLPDNAMRVIGGAAAAVHGIGDKEAGEAEGGFKGGLVNIRHGAGGGRKRPEKDDGGESGGKRKKDSGPTNNELLSPP